MFNLNHLMMGLRCVSDAFNNGNEPLALMAAVLMKLPDLDWDGAVRIADADIVFHKYNEDQPRDWHGRWVAGDGIGTSSAGSNSDRTSSATNINESPNSESDQVALAHDKETDTPQAEATNSFPLPDNWLHLPPGNRSDELGDLLEWIANARPEDARAIHNEIDRVYRDNGDLTGAFILHAALSDVLEDQDEATRAEVLRDCEYLTRSDPKEMIYYLTLGSLAAAFGPAGAEESIEAEGLGARIFEEAPPATASADAEVAQVARTEGAASSVWQNLGWAARGQYFEETYRGEPDLPSNFPVIDRFPASIATSFKSIDLNAATYQNEARLSARINLYIDSVADFEGAYWRGTDIRSVDIKGRVLNLGVLLNSETPMQNSVIDAARVRAKGLGVDLIVTPF